MSIYTISSNKVPISLLNFSRYSSLANICTSRPLYTWGLSLINPKVPSLGATIGYLSQQSTTISMEAFPLYMFVGPASSQLFSRTHYSSIWHSHKITSNKWSSIHRSTIVSSHGNPTHPLQSRESPTHPFQSRGSPMHYTIGIRMVLCITPLGSLQTSSYT